MTVSQAKEKIAAIVGRTIVKADPRFHDDGGHCGTGRDAHYAHDWHLTLDDGSTVRFVTEETEGSEYGVNLIVSSTSAQAARLRIDHVLVISTAHLRPKTLAYLSEGDHPLNVLSWHDGVMLNIDFENREVEPELRKIGQYARRIGATWVRFDADADTVKGLPVFPS